MSDPVAALQRVASAAALRSPQALWRALEDAVASGASQEDLQEAIEVAAASAADSVRSEAAAVLREVLARKGARERWGMLAE